MLRNWTVRRIVELLETDFRRLDDLAPGEAARLLGVVKAAGFRSQRRILDAILDNRDSAYISDYATGYSEPGYEEPRNGIVFLGSWGVRKPGEDLHHTLLAGVIETIGCEIEWHDEWTLCDHCGKAIRTSANSYSWQRSYAETDDGRYCHVCIRGHAELREAYIDVIKGDPVRADTLNLDLTEFGYEKLDHTFEHGWYGGQDDDPKAIAAALSARGIDDFVFQIDSVGQFDLAFTLWVPTGTSATLADLEGKAAEDPVAVLQQGLAAATQAVSELPDTGIKYVQLQPDGTVKARTVTPEEFVRGIGRDDKEDA